VPRVEDLVQLNFSPNQAKHLIDPNGGWYQPFLVSNGVYTDETWVYASATTVTVITDATTRYQIGDKARFKQGAGYLYFYVGAVAATTLTLVGGSNYTVANATITDIAISRDVRPFGFPAWFDWTPTYSAISPLTWTSVTNNYAKFRISMREFIHNLSATGTMGGTGHPFLTYTTPTGLTLDSVFNGRIGSGLRNNNGTWGMATLSRAGAGTIYVSLDSQANWAATGTAAIQVLGNGAIT
jgi:hypothetical protein